VTRPPAAGAPSWKTAVAEHQTPTIQRSLWQLVNSVVPYLALWGLMIRSVDVSYGLTLLFALPAAGFLVRIFIIFHDCGHGSFFRSRRANHFWGVVTGVLTYTPFQHWRHDHSIHHATSGDLDRRGVGDIWTLTVNEYLDAPRWKRLAYRMVRSPFVLFVLAPAYVFLIQHRLPSRASGTRERWSVLWTNLTLLAIVFAVSLAIGFERFVLIQLPVSMIAGAAGVWLFYVQHQFEGVTWKRREEWDFVAAALDGSSFYRLPKVLQWFSGNIGFHHIHHLSPAVPNYNLEKCHRAEPLFQSVTPITLLGSLKSLSFRLWDEQQARLVGYGRMRAVRRANRALAGTPPGAGS
jgi:omega-6 fatty acid desaturase (delta-12 desaturase)